MLTVRLRVIGSEADAASLITVLHGLEGIEHVEQIADLAPYMDDDSSSAGLSDDVGMHSIEVDVPDRILAERVRRVAGNAAEWLGTSVEYVDEF
jgi:hypothetical protein